MQVFDLTDMHTINQLLSDVEGSEFIQKRKHYWKSSQVSKGDVAKYVYEEIASKRQKSKESYIVSDIYLSEIILKRIAKAYKQKPIRKVGSSEQKTLDLDFIYEEADAERQLEEFDRTYNRDRHALMWVQYREKEDRFYFMALSPYEYFVVRDKDTGELIGVVLNYPDTTITDHDKFSDSKSSILSESQADGAAESTIYVMWSKDNVVKVQVKKSNLMNGKVSKDVTLLPIDGNPNNINKLGLLPFVYKSMDNSVDDPAINPITEQTIKFNYQHSEYLTASNVSAGIAVLSFDESKADEFKNMNYGLTTAVELPQPSNPDKSKTEFSFVSPSTDLAGMKEACNSYLIKVLEQHGISNGAAIKEGASMFNSGIERLIADAPTQEVVTMNQKTYVKLEKEMFAIINRYLAFKRGKSFGDDELSITFQKPKVLISDREILENIEKRINLGLMTKEEALMTLDPNLSEEEAKKKIDTINKEKQSNANGLMNGLPEADEDDRPF